MNTNTEVNSICISCTRLNNGCEGTRNEVYTGCVYRQRADESKAIVNPRISFNPAADPDLRYIVRLWKSYDGGKTFYDIGIRKYFRDFYEAESWRKRQRKNLVFDLMFGHLGNGITVANRASEENGDYTNVAHIDIIGAILYYIDPAKLPPYALEEINRHAATQAEEFRRVFLKMSYPDMLSVMNDYLTYDEYNGLLQEIKEDDRENVYEILTKCNCRGGRRVMPTA